MTKQIPYILRWDKMPINISAAFGDEKPAGKHGFLRAKGDKFFFEDGTPAAFWGTNFNAGANFPDKDYAEKVAKRLSAVGMNIVRLHQLDTEWGPNIFEFEKGNPKNDTRSFDPESMDRLDYLIYCLKKEGIYIYMDFITYRRFRPGDGLPNTHLLRVQGRPFNLFDRRMIELQKEFIYNFLTHKNPYTGLCYNEEPAIVMAEMTNENDIISVGYCPIDDVEPYISDLRARLAAFDTEHTIDAATVDLNTKERPEIVTRFLFQIQKDYTDEMIAYTKSIGAKFMLTGTNWCVSKLMPLALENADFTDAHDYFHLGTQWEFNNKSMMRDDWVIPKRLTFQRRADKPFFCSEWGMPWPNEYRAEAPIYLAAVGGLQGFGGYAIHTYRYDCNTDESITHRIGRNVLLGGGRSRGTFNCFNDPAGLGLFYHAALITRRFDVKEAQESVTRGFEKEALFSDNWFDYGIIGETVAERHKVYMGYDEPSRGDIMYSARQVESDTGEIYRDKDRGYGFVDTPRTKAVYGFHDGSEEKLSGLTIKSETDFATIALSSLTDEPLSKSDNILLTAVGRADNAEVEYNETHTGLTKDGRPPVMIEVIEAEIALKTEMNNLVVYPVNDEGFYMGALETTYENGVLRFKIGGDFSSMYYLIQKL